MKSNMLNKCRFYIIIISLLTFFMLLQSIYLFATRNYRNMLNELENKSHYVSNNYEYIKNWCEAQTSSVEHEIQIITYNNRKEIQPADDKQLIFPLFDTACVYYNDALCQYMTVVSKHYFEYDIVVRYSKNIGTLLYDTKTCIVISNDMSISLENRIPHN